MGSIGISTYSLIIAIIGGLILFFACAKGGVKKKYKAVFIVIGIILVVIGLYGLIVDLLN